VVGCTRICTNASDGQDLFYLHRDLVNGPYKLILMLNVKAKYTQLPFVYASENAGPTMLNKCSRFESSNKCYETQDSHLLSSFNLEIQTYFQKSIRVLFGMVAGAKFSNKNPVRILNYIRTKHT